MVEIKILVPLRGNDGVDFTDTDHAQYEAQLLALFGGFTREPVPYTGGWKDENGVTYLDATFAYVVFVNGLLASAHDVLAAVTFAKAHYAQLAITVRYLGQAEIL